MDIKWMPSLLHLSYVKVVQPLLLDHDIGEMLDRDLMIPDCRDYFQPGKLKLWHRIEKAAIEKMPRLPSSLEVAATKCLHAMHGEHIAWLNDHDLSPMRKGFDVNYRNLICWTFDGKVDREKTAKKYIHSECIDVRDRFIMACTYCLEDEILDLWDLVKVVNLKTTSRRGINAAVRLWTNLLRKGHTTFSNEMIKKYLNVRSVRESDIPLRIATYFRFLPEECKRIFLRNFLPPTIHSDDFHSCFYQMDEIERIAMLELESGIFLAHFLKWPYQSIFIRMATEVSSQLTLNDVKSILELFKIKILNGYDYSELFEKFWNIIPDIYKPLIRLHKRKYKTCEVILNYDRKNQTESLVEMVAEHYFS